jgi:VWFA-related protein
MRRTAWLGLASVAVAGMGILAQERTQQPSFRTGVHLVRIDVSVLDDKRQPVRGLQASDFTVLEDGKPRPVRAFTAVDHTAAAAPLTPMPLVPAHDVATNRVGDATSRLIFILMDRSIPPERPMLVARQIADAAVDAMAPGDLAAIVTTGGGVPQNLTTDRARLHKTIAATNWSETISQTELDDPNLVLIRAFGLLDSKTDGACLCGVCGMDTIAHIATQVRDVPRRKVLLYVGGNLTVQAGMNPGDTRGMSCDKVVRDSRERLYDALGTSGLTVHSIDPQGLATVGPATRTSVPNGIENRDGRVLNGQLTQETMDFLGAQGNLGILPERTGGRTVLNTNAPEQMVPAVLHESDAYYLLAFEPVETTGDARHDIEVKVARKGVHVHTARYLASAKAIAAAAAAVPLSPIERALTALLPDASLPLEMSVASFAGPDRGHTYVGITLDASAFATAPGTIPLQIAVSATDERGKRIGGALQNGSVEVPPSAAGSGTVPFVELQTYMTLAPGDYELRTAVMNSETHAVSSVFTHVTVPAFDDKSLALSDIVLGTRENTGSLPAAAPAISVAPTTARLFSSGDAAWAFLRVYRPVDNGIQTPPVSVETIVLDAAGNPVEHQVLREAAFVGREAGVRVALPLKRLAAGRYVLRIEAKQARAEVSREIGFAVAQGATSFTQEHSPALDAALAAAANYIEAYERRISAISAEETYLQAITSPGTNIAIDSPPARPRQNNELVLPSLGGQAITRKTRANITTISLGARGWVSFRDVFEVDGRPVADGIERLSRILQDVNPDSLAQAQQIAAESARYNLEPQTTRINRTINVPMTALLYLRAANQNRSSFRVGRSERIGGVQCMTLLFDEQSQPRLTHTVDNAPAHGTFWIDMAGGGRIVKTELRMDSSAGSGQLVNARTAVTYTRVEKLNLWVPTLMDESYELPAMRQIITGRATYSDFREFKVTTTEGIKDIK